MEQLAITVFVAAAIILRLGQMMICAGAARSHSAAAAAARLLLDLATAALSLWAIGAIWVPPFSIDMGYGNQGMALITFSNAAGISSTSYMAMGVLPLLILSSGTLVGAMQDRARLTPILVLSVSLGALVMPVLVQIAMRLIFAFSGGEAGVGLAAVVGGSAALTAARVVGPRRGKFNRDQSANVLPGHHVPLQYFGMMLILISIALLCGQFPHVLLGASAAALAGALFGRLRFSKIDTGLVLAAVIGGVMAAGVMNANTPTWAAVFAGAVAGGLTPWVLVQIETRFRIDDAAGLSSGTLVGGLIGMIVTPLTTSTSIAHRLSGLCCNCLVAVIAVSAACGVALAVCRWFQSRDALRLTESEEFEGVDLSEFDLNAYPDFQQTMIKSHHLRQI